MLDPIFALFLFLCACAFLGVVVKVAEWIGGIGLFFVIMFVGAWVAMEMFIKHG
jgi:hypothetical protein